MGKGGSKDVQNCVTSFVSEPQEFSINLFQDVVQVKVLLKDIGDFAAVNEEYANYFKTKWETFFYKIIWFS